ncbi:hypothetical protein MFLAVUS_010960 [Mucor flavus]|uniref:sphingomyelin phosphodiesterase n=1 Tax=Mucor flavus TaxID=439312 RepID=A0ABP9ZE65_9FUNG
MSLLAKKGIKLTEHSIPSRMTENDRRSFEVSPLLNEGRVSMTPSEEEEVDILAAAPAICSRKKKGPQWQNCRATFCCCTSKKARIILCLLVILLPILSFTLFCSIYFSAASLPTDTIPLDQVSSLQQTTTAPRLLTFNMFMRPPGIKNNKDDFKNERLEYIVQNILPHYDIITVQEAFAYANRRIDTLLSAAFAQGFYYHVASARHYPWHLAGDGGLLILSRFPIKKSNRIEFSRGVHSDWLSFKGALHALIELNPTQHIHVYTTHTQASYDNGGAINFDDTKVRLSQFAAVHQFISDTAKNDTHPILLMGDLNVDAATHDDVIEQPSRHNSLAYTMMMDVLTGKGTRLDLIDNKTSSETVYASDWKLNDLTDIAYKTYGYHPITFGDYKKLDNGSLVPAETTLTSHNQLMTVQSIDRLLWSSNNNTHISIGNLTVEPFFTSNETNQPFTQISDHYGLSALLYL